MNRNKAQKDTSSSSASNVDDSSFRAAESRVDSPDAESLKRAEKALVFRLVKTQRAIRRVDLFTAFCAFATLALGVLFLGVLCDSWILSSGLSARGRVFFMLSLLVVSLLCFLWKLAPVLGRRVNALYAARALEETQQDKHNLTINWLQLCRGGSLSSRRPPAAPLDGELSEQAEETRRAVLQNVALQAARKVSEAPSETSVDCSSLIRWGIAFACLVTIGSIYAVLSPKNPFASAGRIIAPLANIERPQALRFESVKPGDINVFQGDFIDVEATIPGAKSSETVEILWSTEDGRITDVAIPMDSFSPTRFRASFPEGNEGFNENLLYKVVAGRGTQFESVSDEFRVTVRPQPSFRVVKTTLIFPEYTGLPPQTFDNQGDVRAVEGASVEIVAQANEKIARAYLLPDGDQTRAVKMEVSADEPEIATASFTLQWKDSDAQDRTPEFTTYSLQSEDVNGEKNRDAQVYTVSILPDLPPTIRWETEESDAIQVPLNDVLRVQFSAEDPDYSLRRVLLYTAYGNVNQGDQADQKPDPEPIELPLASSPKTPVKDGGPTPFVGPQSLFYPLVPEKLGLGVGDELEYWGVAFDSKFPDANVGISEKRVFVVVDPVDNPSDLNEETSENNQNEESGDAQAPGSSQGGSSSSNEQQGENNNPDGETGNDMQTGDQGDSSDERPETSGQEGEESESAAPNGSGSETGETPPDGDKSQNQESEGQEGGNQGGESTSDAEQSKGDGQGSENDQGSEQEGSKSDGPSNDFSDEDSKGTAGSGSSRSDETGNTSSENASAADNLSEDDPSGDETQPEEAFQKILDFMNERQKEANHESTSEFDNEEQSDGSSSGQDGNRGHSDSPDSPRESENEVDPAFDPSGELDDPQGKRELPKRTSAEKPDEHSPVYQADNPEKIDPNTRRRQDNVDPEGNDFIAQNVDPAQSESTRPEQKRNDANIMVDPLDQTPGTAADSIDHNSPEAKGGSNVPETGATEVDPNAPNDPERSSTPNQEQDQNRQSPSTGNGAPESGDGQSERNDSQNGGEGAGPSNDRNSSKKNNASPSNGTSDNNGIAHGGGAAGTGHGEIEQGEEQLAPADAPRLQYAEQATNLVLEYLEDSLKDKVDERLLNELGWTEAEMRAFLKKWKQMRDAALKDDGLDRDRYLKALEKVGFDEYASLDDTGIVDSTRERDPDDGRSRTGSREASRVKTPDRLSERVRAFTRGVSSGTGSK